MFACRIFSQAEMEQAQLSELLMQITRLNKLNTIFFTLPQAPPRTLLPIRFWEGGVSF